jgi:YHS domain-containing protein
MAIDPVCLKEVDEKTAEFKSKVRGRMYYFTDAECKKKFDENPAKYLDKSKKNDTPPYAPC